MKLFKTIMPLMLMICFMANVNAQKLEQYIPKDATFVVSFNLNNLNKKVSLEKIQSYDFYQEGFKEMMKEVNRNAPTPELADAFENPSKYGIDIMSETFIYGDITDDKGSFFGLVFNLNDQQKFTDFFTKNVLPEAKGEMGNMNGFQTMTMKNGAIAWNKNVGIITGGTLWGSIGYDSDAEHAEKEEAIAVQGYLQRRLKANPTTSLLANAKFQKEALKKSDMKMWMDYEWVMKMQMEDQDALQMMGMDSFMETMAPMYKDIYLSSDLNFNDGKVEWDTKMFANQEMMDMWKRVSDRQLNKNFFKYLPKENMMGYLTAALNFENYVEEMTKMFEPMIEESGTTVIEMENMALDFLASSGINIDRKGMYNLLKGDMVMAVTGMREFDVTKTQYDEDFNRVEVKSKQTLPEFLMMMSYGNQADIMKFIKVGVDSGMLGKQAGKFNAYKVAIPASEMPMDVFVAVHDGILFFTNNNELISKKLKKGYKKKQRMTKKDILTVNNSGSMFFWDIPKTLNAAAAFATEQGMMDGMSTKMLNVSKQSLESMVFRADKVVTDATRMEFDLNFVNKKMNSLDQMFSYFNEMYLTAMSGSSM